MTFLDRIKNMVVSTAKPSPPKATPALDSAARAYFADQRNWQGVASSNVYQVAYFADLDARRGVLGVRFWPEGQARYSEYVYFGVHLSVYTDLLSSASKGRFTHERLKGRYDCRKLN